MSAATSRLLSLAPSRTHTRAITTYGIALDVRAYAADDLAETAALYARLSDRSRYQRFMAAKPRLTRQDLDFLAAVDHRTHDAVVAVDPSDGRIVGEARYVRWNHRAGAADLAFVVDDVWHGQGIASLLGREALRRARANGYELLTASTFAENVAARAVLRRLGFTTRSMGAGVVDLELTVT
jgi:acetyltransferase